MAVMHTPADASVVRADADPDGLLVTGSLYVVGDARAALEVKAAGNGARPGRG